MADNFCSLEFLGFGEKLHLHGMVIKVHLLSHITRAIFLNITLAKLPRLEDTHEINSTQRTNSKKYKTAEHSFCTESILPAPVQRIQIQIQSLGMVWVNFVGPSFTLS